MGREVGRRRDPRKAQKRVSFIRDNLYSLDPSGRYEDASLWEALESVDMKAFVTQAEEGLDTNIAAGGENLSAGQRQLLSPRN